MKKIIVFFIALIPSFAFAQFSKGQVFIGGTLSTSLQSSNVKDVQPNGGSNLSKNNSLSISPGVGFFLNPKIAIGGGINYNYSFQQYDYLYLDYNTGTYINDYSKYSTNGIGISAFTRYYMPLSNSIYFALQGQINFTRANRTNVNKTGTQETTQEIPSYSLGLTIKPVFIFFPSPKWGIEASVGSLGYTYQRGLPDVSSSDTFIVSAGSFSLGLAYYFAKK
jgi:hypothetical protein